MMYQRWFLRGFAKRSLVSVFAFLSALFSRIDFPAFLALPLLGDFPDNGITAFLVSILSIPYRLKFLMPVHGFGWHLMRGNFAGGLSGVAGKVPQ
jgi:lipopolysaccharide export LptBFGC system permease protein LptF